LQLLALALLAHQDVYDVVLISVDGNAWTNPIAGVPNIIRTMEIAGCASIPVAYGPSQSMLDCE
jgi:hypothetical protein